MSKGSGVKGKTMQQLARTIGAAKRQTTRDARSPQKQLALVRDRPGNSLREQTKLEKLALVQPTQAAKPAATQEPAITQEPAPKPRKTHRGHRAKKPDE